MEGQIFFRAANPWKDKLRESLFKGFSASLRFTCPLIPGLWTLNSRLKAAAIRGYPRLSAPKDAFLRPIKLWTLKPLGFQICDFRPFLVS